VSANTFGVAIKEMPRKLAILVCASIAVLCLFVWLEGEFAHSFQTCIAQNMSQKAAPSPHEESRVIGDFVVYRLVCSVRLIDSHNGFFSALAAMIIAGFTITIWSINRSQLKHSHEVERAYISGGGVAAPEAQDISITYQRADTIVHLTKKVIGGTFQLHINNQGKTPGELLKIGLGFCDAATQIPDEPIYDITTYSDWIGPGTQSRPVRSFPIPSDFQSPAVYGRFYYRDIFGREHSSGFILEITHAGTQPILAPKAYTQYD
jgi:hypothetical protein